MKLDCKIRKFANSHYEPISLIERSGSPYSASFCHFNGRATPFRSQGILTRNSLSEHLAAAPAVRFSAKVLRFSKPAPRFSASENLRAGTLHGFSNKEKRFSNSAHLVAGVDYPVFASENLWATAEKRFSGLKNPVDFSENLAASVKNPAALLNPLNTATASAASNSPFVKGWREATGYFSVQRKPAQNAKIPRLLRICPFTKGELGAADAVAALSEFNTKQNQ